MQGFGPTPAAMGQTAPAAEWAAAEVAAAFWQRGLPPPYADCKQVVDALGHPDVRRTLTRGLLHGGSVRRVLGGFGGLMPVEKVKAHRAEQEATDQADLCRILGNQGADTAAGLGAKSHPKPSPIEAATARREWNLLQAVIRFAVDAAHRWPSLRTVLAGRAKRVVRVGVGGAEAPKRERGRPAIPEKSRHHFDCFGGSILCERCLCRAHSWPAARRREDVEACGGVCIPMRTAFESSDLGHTLCMGVYDGRPTIICITCGAYATEKVHALTSPCGQRPPVKGGESIRRFRRGFHPDGKKAKVVGEAFFRILAGGVLEEFSPGGV